MSFKFTTLIESIELRIKTAGRYTRSAFFISVCLLSIPFTLNVLSLIIIFSQMGKLKLQLVSILVSGLVICFLYLMYRKKNTAPDAIIDKKKATSALLQFGVYLIISIVLFIYAKISNI